MSARGWILTFSTSREDDDIQLLLPSPGVEQRDRFLSEDWTRSGIRDLEPDGVLRPELMSGTEQKDWYRSEEWRLPDRSRDCRTIPEVLNSTGEVSCSRLAGGVEREREKVGVEQGRDGGGGKFSSGMENLLINPFNFPLCSVPVVPAAGADWSRILEVP